MASRGWSTQQLAEFVAAVSAATTESAAARAAVERAAEALDAEVVAIVGGGQVFAAVGYADGMTPVGDLEAIQPGVAVASLEVPGVGICTAAAAALEHPPGSTLVVARSGPDSLTSEESGLLRAMARVASLTMWTQSLLDQERAAREELEGLAGEQAALRRVATLVAQGEPPSAVFAAVAEEVGRVVPAADVALVGRYASEGALEFVGGWSMDGDPSFIGTRVPLGGTNVSTIVFERNEPTRVDYFPDDANPASALAREWSRSSAGAPINVEGRLWGVMVVGSLRPDGLPPGIERELAGFTDLVATAIANSQAREELAGVADWQASLRRVATLVARSEPPEVVFAAIAKEMGRLFLVDATGVVRYEPDGVVVPVGSWTGTGQPGIPGERATLGGRNVTTLVYETGRPARIDAYAADDLSAVTAIARSFAMRSAIGAPMNVEGRLWGSLQIATSREDPLPAVTEERLDGFADLAATAIANAQAREELRTLAEEQAALRRVATLVARGTPAAEILDAVTEEVHRLLRAEQTGLYRYDPDGLWTVLANCGALTDLIPVGSRLDPGASTPGVAELLSGRPVRVDAPPVATAVDDLIRAEQLQAWVASPIVLMGRTWGQVAVFSRHGPLPTGTEDRLGSFTELAATAIANAEAQAELTASRARIVATADETRRRIERDLHDGAQQRLVTLALQLRAAQAAVPRDLHGLVGELDEVSLGLSDVLDDLREFARGIHPAILAEGGLASALKGLSRRSPIPVDIELRMRGRLPEAIEVGAYYVVSEALANAAKHADASVISVEVTVADGALRIWVRDDGVGGATFARGSGLVGLKDRVEALGGHLSVDSPRGKGTSIQAELPLAKEAG